MHAHVHIHIRTHVYIHIRTHMYNVLTCTHTHDLTSCVNRNDPDHQPDIAIYNELRRTTALAYTAPAESDKILNARLSAIAGVCSLSVFFLFVFW